MQRIILLIRQNKTRVILSMIWAIVMIFALGFFYYLKASHDYFISSQTKLIIVACILASTLLVLFRIKFPNWLSYILEICTILGSSIFLFTYLEPLVNSMEDFRADARNINILIIFAVIVFSFGLTRNAGFGIGIGGFIVYAIYLIDYFTVAFRGTPFVLSDILSSKTALGVASGYHFVLDERMLVSFFVLALIASFGSFVNVREQKFIQHVATAIAGIAVGSAVIVLLVFTEVITKGDFRTVAFIPINSARQNGLPLNIISSLKDSFIVAPEGFSEKAVSEIIDSNFTEESLLATDIVKPNIIVIMNESFTDFDYLLHVQLTEEPLPKFKALSENCIKGTLISSIYGGNTPNSEFEFLTGCSLAFLPQGIVTFQQLIDHELPTFVTHLEDLGYSSTAIHLYNPEYFSRSRIYPLLGFDEFISIENSNVPIEMVYDYASDASSFNAIEKIYESSNGNPFFAFCVTIQNHGGYWHWGRDILVTNANSDYANDYASLLKKTDDAFADLLDYFSNVKEPTLIVMYGDHQPNLFDDFYESIWDGYFFTDEEQTYLKAKVPFIIWANYDIAEETYDDMSINYLAPIVLKTAGLPLSGYQTYLDNLRKSIPVVSGIGYVDKDGLYFTNSADSKYEDLLRDYSLMQYYYLKKDAAIPFFK
ncbi:MAG: LTA synthase family protein [Lachnospiraceae bacterium]|nr:LTA synthase family protein [Lachnospiraceae bacterium]